jgi:hypothetical protein
MDDTLSRYDESLEALERQRESLELVMQRMGEEWEERYRKRQKVHSKSIFTLYIHIFYFFNFFFKLKNNSACYLYILGLFLVGQGSVG